MTWVLIANPAAGGGRGRRLAERAARELGPAVDLRLTQAPGHAQELARQALKEGCQRLVVLGGDGTLHEVLPALAHTQVPLGLLPCGTGNDLARALGVPRNLDQALGLLRRGRPSSIDLARAGEALFCTVAAFGFDAQISEAMRQGQIPFSGTAGYLYATLGHLSRFTPLQVRLEGEFGGFEGQVLLVATANTRSYGGGMKIAPAANPRDGKLEVCIVRELPRRQVLALLPRLFWGDHVHHQAVRIERTAWLRLHSAQPQLLHADGEPLAHTPLTIEALPRALQVVLPD
ncbi:MAG: diacylglycerol kinase family lipid kinase [Candidatus Handelsmanbacteria bacterium]|nr:diacylglycerol kinase family lipid kinase [Candidatus Handelsmanbacteria bacterium]